MQIKQIPEGFTKKLKMKYALDSTNSLFKTQTAANDSFF